LSGFDLTVAKAGTGAGSVVSSPAGISCGADCFESYSPGTVVTLRTTPTSGSTFVGWTGGGCTGTDPCVMARNTPVTVTATFSAASALPPAYALTATKAGTGGESISSNPAGVSCGSDCSEAYAAGTTVTLSAAPAGNSTFAGWSGGCSGTGSCTVVMTASTSVTATFTKKHGRKP
jgi:Divergent InlB B-repeat domain